MNYAFQVILTLVAAQQPTIETTEFRYAAAVGFYGKRCTYWTGDVMLDADGFRADLEARFDTSKSLTISHAKGVPSKCVSRAIMAARKAGFKDVISDIGDVDLSVPK